MGLDMYLYAERQFSPTSTEGQALLKERARPTGGVV